MFALVSIAFQSGTPVGPAKDQVGLEHIIDQLRRHHALVAFAGCFFCCTVLHLPVAADLLIEARAAKAIMSLSRGGMGSSRVATRTEPVQEPMIEASSLGANTFVVGCRWHSEFFPAGFSYLCLDLHDAI